MQQCMGSVNLVQTQSLELVGVARLLGCGHKVMLVGAVVLAGVAVLVGEDMEH